MGLGLGLCTRVKRWRGYHLNGIHLAMPSMHYGQLLLETDDPSTTLVVGGQGLTEGRILFCKLAAAGCSNLLPASNRENAKRANCAVRFPQGCQRPVGHPVASMRRGCSNAGVVESWWWRVLCGPMLRHPHHEPTWGASSLISIGRK